MHTGVQDRGVIISHIEMGLRQQAVARDAGGRGGALFLKMEFLNGLNLMEHPKGGRQVSSTTLSDLGQWV